MTYYAALDVSLRSVNVCIVNDAGEVKFEAKVDSEVDAKRGGAQFGYRDGGRV